MTATISTPNTIAPNAQLNTDLSLLDDKQFAPVHVDLDFASNVNLSALFAAEHLSPELMLAFVEQQLGNIDGQINDMIKGIEDRNDRARTLRAGRDALATHTGNVNDDDMVKIGGPLAETLEHLEQSGEPAVREAAGNLSNQGDNGSVTAGEVKAALGKIDHALDNLSSTNDIDRLKLQQLVQDRSQIISFSSNVMASLNESKKQVIGNIR